MLTNIFQVGKLQEQVMRVNVSCFETDYSKEKKEKKPSLSKCRYCRIARYMKGKANFSKIYIMHLIIFFYTFDVDLA